MAGLGKKLQDAHVHYLDPQLDFSLLIFVFYLFSHGNSYFKSIIYLRMDHFSTQTQKKIKTCIEKDSELILKKNETSSIIRNRPRRNCGILC